MATLLSEPRSDRLLEQIEATQRGMRRFRQVLGSIGVAFVVAGLVAALALADWEWVLSGRARGWGMVVLGTVAAFLLERLVLRPGRQVAREDAASEVETGFPDLGQRVRTTLEYAEPNPETAPAAPGLVRALQTETARRTRDLDLPAVVPWSTLRAPIGALGLILGVALFFIARDPELGVALRRTFLLPGQYTQLVVKPGDQSVKAGGDFTLEAILSGRPVKTAEWRRRLAGSQGAWTAVSLAPEPAELDSDPDGPPRPLLGKLTSTWKDCQETFDYQVVAGPVESPVYQVIVRHPLLLKAVEASVEPPSYTRRPRVTEKTGDLKVIEGSKVHVRFTLDRAPSTAQLLITPATEKGKPGGPSSRVPLTIQGTSLSADLPRLDRTFEYLVEAKAADGMTLELLPYKVRIQADEKPTLRFVHPPEELAVIPTTEVPLEVEAGDDLGVAKVGIVYQINGGPKETLLLDEPSRRPVQVRELITLYLESHKLDYTDGLTYSAFAEDNHPGTPRRTTTDLRYIDILPFQQSFEMSDSECQCQGKCLSLEELIQRQRVNLNRAFGHSEEASLSTEAAGRLSKGEQELLAITTEFTEGLEARFGPVPVLHTALTSMEAAISDLDRKDITRTVVDEEAALAALIKARQNLRKLLKQSSSASACRSFDRAQQQKLRKPPPKKDQNELARQLPEQLKKLAQEERQVSQGLCSNPGQSPSAASSASPKAPESPAKLAERQGRRVEAAQKLQKTVRDDPALSALARDRMDQAAREIQESARALKSDQKEQAADRASNAADQLERLANQVAGLHAKELSARLSLAARLARQLASDEKALGEQLAPGRKPAPSDDPGRKQGALAEDAKTLAEWLKPLPDEAADESRDLSQALRKATRSNPPEEIAKTMQSATEVLKTGNAKPAAGEVNEAAERLAALAQDLDDARRSFMQPQLDQLLAAEAQAARTQATLRSAHNEGEKAEGEKALSDLLETLRKLQAREGESKTALASATETLAEVQRRRGGGWGGFAKAKEGEPENRPVLVPPGQYTEGVTHVITALQARIQEVVLKEMLLDNDEAVPPQYKTLVEDYYKTLSEDLR